MKKTDFFYDKINFYAFKSLSDMFNPRLINFLDKKDDDDSIKTSLFFATLRHSVMGYEPSINTKYLMFPPGTLISFCKADLTNLLENKPPNSFVLKRLYDKNLYIFYSYVVIGIYLDVFRSALEYLYDFSPGFGSSGYIQKNVNLPNFKDIFDPDINFFYKNFLVKSNKVFFFKKNEQLYLFITE